MGLFNYAKKHLTGYFSINRRFSRLDFFMSIILCFIVTFTALAAVSEMIPVFIRYGMYVFCTVFSAGIVFITAKRFHDLNKSWLHLFTLLIPVYNVCVAFTLLFKRGTDCPNSYGEIPGGSLSIIKRSGIWLGLIVLFTTGSLGILILLYGTESAQANNEQTTKIKLRYANGRLKEKCTVIKNENGDFMLDGKYTYWYDNGQIAVNCFYDRCRLVDSASGKPWNPEPGIWDLQIAELSMRDDRITGRTGSWISWYEDGKKRGKCRYKNGMLEGRFTKWRPDGRKSLVCSYRNGKKDGREIHWFDNGQKSYECTHKNNEKDGWEISWFENGQKAQQCVYKNGKKEGMENHWHVNGVKSYECFHNHGAKDKWEISWLKNGQKSKEYAYENGKKEGLGTHWYDNGSKSYECPYKNGEKDGLEVSWRKDGQKSQECSYKNDRKDGWEIRWDDSLKMYECPYKNGEKDGLETSWRKDGQKSQECSYKNDRKDGWEIRWNDGLKMYECAYKNGQKDGLESFWHHSGDKWHECNYINGRKDGFEIFWGSDGEIDEEYTYLDGAQSGDEDGWIVEETAYYDSDTSAALVSFTEWYLNGQKLKEGFLRNGLRTGKYIEWHRNGQIRRENKYISGKKTGKLTRWHINGRMQHLCYYRDGEKHGLETQWFESGQKQRECMYQNGYKHGKSTQWYENGRIRIESQYYYDEQLRMAKWNDEGKIVDRKVFSDEKHCVSPYLFNSEAKFVTGIGPGYNAENWYWEIDGKYLTWGSDTVRIKPTSGVHTIAFYSSNKEKPNTTYCHISEPNTFIIYYNPCCDDYNIGRMYHSPNRSGKAVELIVKGRLEKEPVSFSVINYKATYDCVGRVRSNSGTIVPFPKYSSRSAMESHTDWVEVTLLNCGDDGCSEDDSQSIKFGYVVLDNKPIQIIYDTKLRKLYHR